MNTSNRPPTALRVTPATAHGYNCVEIEELINTAQEVFKDHQETSEFSITLNASHPRKQRPASKFHRPPRTSSNAGPMPPISQHSKNAPVKPTKVPWLKLPRSIASISIATGNRAPKYSSVICILRIHIDCLFQLAPALVHPVRDYTRKDMTRNGPGESALDVTIAAKPYISYVRNKYPSYNSDSTRMLGEVLLLRSRRLNIELAEEDSVNAASSYTCQSSSLGRGAGLTVFHGTYEKSTTTKSTFSGSYVFDHTETELEVNRSASTSFTSMSRASSTGSQIQFITSKWLVSDTLTHTPVAVRG